MKRLLLSRGVRTTRPRLRHVLPALFILCCPLPAAAQAGVSGVADFSDVEVFLKFTLKGEDSLSVGARGDLNGDGLEDWAGVVHRQPPDSAPTYQLYVLLRSPRGGFRVAEKSLEEEIPGAGCCWVEDLYIRRSSIYVQNNAKTVSTMEAATRQFKLHQGEWRLVGVRIYFTDHSPDAPATTDTDINLLTGAVRETRQKGDGRPATTRRRRKFPARLLRDFDFSNGFGVE